MRVLLLAGLTACGFRGPFAGVVGDGGVDSPVAIDGNVVHVDGSPSIDAPPIDAPFVMIDAAHDAPMLDAPDPWPCGPDPTPPPATVTFGNATTGMTASMIALNTVQKLVVTPSQALQLKFHYAIHDSACSSCIDQIEYGFVQGSTGRRIDCALDQTMQQNVTFTGNPPTQAFNAPVTPGQYDLRLAQAENYSCNYMGANDWYGGNPPPANHTIAIICVH